jgi:hypothetical protein
VNGLAPKVDNWWFYLDLKGEGERLYRVRGKETFPPIGHRGDEMPPGHIIPAASFCLFTPISGSFPKEECRVGLSHDVESRTDSPIELGMARSGPGEGRS